MEHSHRTWVEIDQNALRQNAERIQDVLGPETQLLSMVKANAYGHGIKETVPALREVTDWFGVDSLEEAKVVRKYSKRLPVLIVNPAHPNDADEIVAREFHQLAGSDEQLRALEDAAVKQGKPANVHLKVDTGMSRQGFLPRDAAERVLPELLANERFAVAGLATHFANADDPTDFTTQEQTDRLHTLLPFYTKDGLVHAANSSAALLHENARFDLARVGIILYGIWPSDAIERAASEHLELTPTMRLQSRIMQVKTVPEGSGIGYGQTYKTYRPTRVALLPIGYADGYDRRFSNNAEVLLSGQRAPVLGNVSMDLTTVDVTDIPEAAVGDVATLLGPDGEDMISAEELAARIGTIGYEVVTRLNWSLPRVLCHE